LPPFRLYLRAGDRLILLWIVSGYIGCACLVVWEGARRPPGHDFPGKPGEFPSSLSSLVLRENHSEVLKLHALLIFVGKAIWASVHGRNLL